MSEDLKFSIEEPAPPVTPEQKRVFDGIVNRIDYLTQQHGHQEHSTYRSHFDFIDHLTYIGEPAASFRGVEYTADSEGIRVRTTLPSGIEKNGLLYLNNELGVQKLGVLGTLVLFTHTEDRDYYQWDIWNFYPDGNVRFTSADKDYTPVKDVWLDLSEIKILADILNDTNPGDPENIEAPMWF